MKLSDISLLQRIAVQGLVEWEVNAPITSLRRLSAVELVEVETRRCTPWKFGFDPPYDLGDQDFRNDFRLWVARQEELRMFSDRTIVVARITQAGLDFLRTEE